MTAPGLDEDTGHGFYGEKLVVELDVSLAFENEVNFCHLFMIVGAGV